MSPFHQVATSGSSTQFVCEKPLLATTEPDRFQWFRRENDPSQTQLTTEEPQTSSPATNQFNLSRSIGSGPVLTLPNVSASDSGWYLCCVLSAPSSDVDDRKEALSNDDDDDVTRLNINYACSAAELVVNAPNVSTIIRRTPTSWWVIAAVTILVVFVVVGLLALVVCKYHGKLKVFKRAHEAVSSLHNVCPINSTASCSNCCLFRPYNDFESI